MCVGFCFPTRGLKQTHTQLRGVLTHVSIQKQNFRGLNVARMFKTGMFELSVIDHFAQPDALKPML